MDSMVPIPRVPPKLGATSQPLEMKPRYGWGSELYHNQRERQQLSSWSKTRVFSGSASVKASGNYAQKLYG